MRLKKYLLPVALWLAASLSLPSLAQDATTTPAQDALNHSRAARDLAPLDDGVFGERVNTYTGATEFAVTDLVVPGNDRLPMKVQRRFSVDFVLTKRPGPRGNYGDFHNWELDLPFLYGNFVSGYPWTDRNGSTTRCGISDLALATPPSVIGTDGVTVFTADNYWSGNFLHLPQEGDQELLHIEDTATDKPQDGKSYHWATRGRWYFSCLQTTSNGQPGDAFLAISPDGTRYWFDRKLVGGQSRVSKGTEPGSFSSVDIVRHRNQFYPTRIQDRFGNWMTFTYLDSIYAGVDPHKVSRMDASDGRQITFTYDNADGTGFVSSVSDGTHAWTYNYLIVAKGSSLLSANRPDGSQWRYDFNQFHIIDAEMSDAQCGEMVYPSSSHTVSITHPSGAMATFDFSGRLNARTNVPKHCWSVNGKTGDRVSLNLPTTALTKKTVTGPGLGSSLVWQWSYENVTPKYESDCAAGCQSTKWVKLTRPEGIVNFTYGIRYNDNEGQLLRADYLASDGITVLRSETSTYLNNPTGQSFASKIGDPFKIFNELGDSTPQPEIQRSVLLQGTTFAWSVNQADGLYSFDRYANPLTVTRSTSGNAGGNFSRTETTAYYHDTAKWVIGQVASVREVSTGNLMSRINFDPSSDLPADVYRFEALQQSMSYNSDGTLASLKDGRNNVTRYSDWYRGVSRKTEYPIFLSDNVTPVSESATTNSTGTIAATTDELGYITTYGYDAMDRLTRVTYPTADTTTWNDVSNSFLSMAVDEYGISAGHWKRTEATGNGRATTFYNALWQPVLTLTEDTGSSASKSFVVSRYDSAGRLAFTSYPVGSLVTVNDVLLGSSIEYDALGRLTKVKQDSELAGALAVLTTTTEYLPGFQTRVTNPNPRGYSTTTSYQVFDTPDTSRPVLIVAPEGVTTTITRDVFGKPLTVTRSGPAG